VTFSWTVGFFWSLVSISLSKELPMAETFAELYAPLLKEVFTVQARQQLDAGADGMTLASEYAEHGKPDFVLGYLLLIDVQEEVQQELLAYAYERRATLSEQKAEALAAQFHRPFPLIKLEAQKDRLAARQVRQGRRVRRDTTAPKMFGMN